jgi:hypothetical protein
MNLSPLVVVAIVMLTVIVALIVLYHLAEKHRRFGKSCAVACAVLARLPITLHDAMQNAAAYCQRVGQAALESLNYTADGSMRDLTRAVTDFFLGLLVIVGESVQVIEVLGNLFPAASQVELPPVFEYTAAALFILCSAMFGELVLDCWRGKGLLQNKGKLSRWCVGILAMLLLVFSDLVNGYFYIFRAEILAHKDTSGMTVYILGGLGLMVSAIAPYALYLVKENSATVVVFLLWIAEKTFQAVHALATFLPELLDTIALHLSGGEVGVYGTQIAREPHQYPPYGNSSPGYVTVKEENQAFLPEHASTLVDAEHEVQPMNTEQVVCLTFNGGFGNDLQEPLKVEVLARPSRRIRRMIRSSGRVNQHHPGVAPGLGTDVSPKHLLGGLAEQFEEMSENIVRVHSPVNIPSLHIHNLDWRDGDKPFQMLKDVSRRLNVTQLAVTQVSQADLRRPQVREFLNGLVSLKKEGVLAAILIVGNDSLLALRLGSVKFFEYIAHAVVQLIACELGVTICHELGQVADFFTLAMDSASVDSGKQPSRGFLSKPFSAGKSVSGNPHDCLSQAFEITVHVMEEQTYQAFGKPVSLVDDCYLIYTIPFADSRFSHIERLTDQQVRAVYRSAHTVHIPGSPVTPLHGSSTQFRVGVTALYPVWLPEIEYPVRTEVTAKDRASASAELSDETITFDIPASLDGNAPTTVVRGRGRPRKEK